jgi:hypothetical protein
VSLHRTATEALVAAGEDPEAPEVADGYFIEFLWSER